ncbi:flagellar biosynthesis protein FlhB [Rheinheimera sp. 1928-s]|uniref:flagellar biosynthesis protein FlhB n=1 Tax=Rheinheimera sp. 1928-s TaxID=3033803 RepID=UPI002628B031|nr:flagellar biosynthesis protein FlhB [Rheinheimera sp. 1928-s]MDF3125790.1 flagellar biosynthesis protein FlhB [Rheinheimera sp. 1928-s]
MATSGQEKTEEPTSKKLEDTRKKGQVARSKDLATFAVLVGSSAGLLIFGKEIAGSVLEVCRRLLSLDEKDIFNPYSMFSVWGDALFELFPGLLKFFLLIMLAAYVGSVLVGGYNFTWQAVGFKWSKLNPGAGIKRMFGLQAMVELVKSIAKVLVIGGLTFALLATFFDDIMALSLMTNPEDIFASAEILAWVFFGICFSVIVIAAIDTPYQLWKHHKELKMTLQEVKDEYKNSEGDPRVKGRIRSLQYQAARRRMIAAVPTADVVVTNPTHFAVALKYDQAKFRAPVVVAKGADEVALYIRRLADENKVPVLESPALARSIFYTTELDHPIPEQLFAAVAQVLAYVYQLNMYKKGKGKRPKNLARDLPIPEDYRH